MIMYRPSGGFLIANNNTIFKVNRKLIMNNKQSLARQELRRRKIEIGMDRRTAVQIYDDMGFVLTAESEIIPSTEKSDSQSDSRKERETRLADLLSFIDECDQSGASISDTLLQRVGSGVIDFSVSTVETIIPDTITEADIDSAVIGGPSSWILQ